MDTLRKAAVAAAMMAVAGMPALAQQGGGTAPAPETPPGGAPQQGPVSDAMVQKVGKALRHTSTISQQYSQRAQAAKSPQQQQALTEQAQSDMVKAIGDEGLSVQQYNQVLQMAQNDPALKQRLLSAAKSTN